MVGAVWGLVVVVVVVLMVKVGGDYLSLFLGDI